jgi:hypothetical protein
MRAIDSTETRRSMVHLTICFDNATGSRSLAGQGREYILVVLTRVK